MATLLDFSQSNPCGTNLEALTFEMGWQNLLLSSLATKEQFVSHVGIMYVDVVAQGCDLILEV